MIRYRLSPSTRTTVASAVDVTCLGHLHTEEGWLAGARLERHVRGWASAEEWIGSLTHADGTFCLVRATATSVAAAVDRVRSFPLFYARVGGELLLSDDPRWLVDRAGGTAGPEDITAAEFLLSGSVSGADTMAPPVKQLRAGEAIFGELSGGRVTVESRRYFHFLPEAPSQLSEEHLRRRLDDTLLDVFRRLLSSVEGAPLIIPLSGGRDSRLVAMLLKRLGRNDVTCFGFGLPGRLECRVAEAVAQALGFRWLFVPYSRKAWRQWYLSSDCMRYLRSAERACVLPILGEWPAIRLLRDTFRVPRGSVFLPGILGDFVCAPGARSVRVSTEGAVGTAVESIFARHFVLQNLDGVSEESRSRLKRRISAVIELAPAVGELDVRSAIRYWEWQEIQSKRVVNAVRAYEFWGFDWRAPFWAGELVRFWAGVSPESASGMGLYWRYVDSWAEKWSLPKPVGAPDRSALKEIARRLVDALGAGTWARKVARELRRVHRRRFYSQDELGLSQIVPPGVLNASYTGVEGVDSFLARDRLDALSGASTGSMAEREGRE